jgi:hypothetical protein
MANTEVFTVLRCMVNSVLHVLPPDCSLPEGSLFFQALLDAHAPLELSPSDLDQLKRIANDSDEKLSITHRDVLKQFVELFDKPTPA